MDLDQAVELLRKVVKNNGTNDERHIDLGLVPQHKKAEYEKAMIVSQLAIQEGKITKDEFKRRLSLD